MTVRAVDPGKTRLAFDWRTVSDRTARALLRDAGISAGGGITQRHRDLLTRAYGRQPSRRNIESRDAWETLRSWAVRDATADQMADLVALVRRSLSGDARNEPVSTQQERRLFIQRRSWTETFKANLHRAFLAAHKTKQPVRSTGSRAVRRTNTGLHELQGRGERLDPLYSHQESALDAMNRMLANRAPERRRGLVVIPTGGGKTRTAATWAVDSMARDPRVRILWLAHQDELLTQAARTFDTIASGQPAGFKRTYRLISGTGSTVSALDDPELDVVFATWQSLNSQWERVKSLLQTYTSRPTIVVVDEAHRAGAQVYETILKHIESAPRIAMVGLTATPWPTGSSAAARMRRRFPEVLLRTDQAELIAKKILAVPVVTTIETHQGIDLSGVWSRLNRGDLPPEVLRQLQNEGRDSLLVRRWLAAARTWGKTLVFATSVSHADELGSRFRTSGVPTKVLHSKIDEDRTDVLRWFRSMKNPCVLISVGMLTEGVDLPDATTAFLARPTTSRVLMMQMVGRVLRGPAAGGAPKAHLVYVRDVWHNFEEVLEPGDIPDLVFDLDDDETGLRPVAPPRIRADSGESIPDTILAQLRRSYAMQIDRIPIDPATSTTELAGYYVTWAAHVPVMAHQLDGYDALIEVLKARQDMRGNPMKSYFGDDYPPYPTQRQLAAVRDHVEMTSESPPFVPLTAAISPRDTASELRRLKMDDQEREKWLRSQYESSLARIAYTSFDLFEEAVEREVREARREEREGRVLSNPESPKRRPSPRVSTRKKRLQRRKDRNLPQLSRIIELTRVHLHGEQTIEPLLSGTYDPPKVEWTDRPISHAWAYWSLSARARNAGAPYIRVNRLLQAPTTQVPEELLEYLLFHELLHDLLPGRGHDTTFRRLEGLWPDADRLDRMLDEMSEHLPSPSRH
jgi:superfamily II DNA or RNA helicase